MIYERERDVFPRGAVRAVSRRVPAYGLAEAGPVARELPKDFGVVVAVDVAESAAGLGERDVRREITSDSVSDIEDNGIGKAV